MADETPGDVGLAHEAVDAGPRDEVAVERVKQSFLVDNAALRGVDEIGAGFHVAQVVAIDQPDVAGAQGHMHGDEVRRGHELVQTGLLQAQALGQLLRQPVLVDEDAHVKGAGALDDLPADAAEADDAQRLAGQVHAQERDFVPDAVHDAYAGRGQVAGEAEHEGKGEFGDGDGVCVGAADGLDTASTRALNVDRLQAAVDAGDDGQLRGRVDNSLVEFRAAGDDDGFVVQDPVLKRGGRERRALDHIDVSLSAQQLQTFRMDGITDQYLGDQQGHLLLHA